MAYKQTPGWIKLLAVAAVAFAIWKYGPAWWGNKLGHPTAAAKAGARIDQCVDRAAAASEAWGGGLARFVNPPYDLSAWDNFRSDVDARISSAESLCTCGDESCKKSTEAMGELKSLVADLDHAIHKGSPPPDDVVRRQEKIDNTINEARSAPSSSP